MPPGLGSCCQHHGHSAGNSQPWPCATLMERDEERKRARSAPGEEPEDAPGASPDAVDRWQTGQGGHTHPVLLPSSTGGTESRHKAPGPFPGGGSRKISTAPSQERGLNGLVLEPRKPSPAPGSSQQCSSPSSLSAWAQLPGLDACGGNAGAACPAPRHTQPRGRTELCVPRAIWSGGVWGGKESGGSTVMGSARTQGILYWHKAPPRPGHTTNCHE